MERDLGKRDPGKRDPGRDFSLSDQFGRVDPFCLVLILPMLLVAVVSLVAGVYIVVTAMLVGAVAIVGFDSWANRPWKLPRQGGPQRTSSRPPRRDDDFWNESDHAGTRIQPNQPDAGSRDPGSRPSQGRPTQGGPSQGRPSQGRGGQGPAPERDPRMQATAAPPPQSWQQRGGPERHPHQPAERSWPRVP